MSAMESIPLVDLVAQYEAHRGEFDSALAAVIGRSSYIGGPDHKAFRADFAAWCAESSGKTGDVAPLGNGTDALELAILELLGQGDGTREIVTVSHTFIATAEAIGRTGYKPVFVDIDPATYLIDLNAMERAITPATAALIPVHLYGQMVDMGRVMEIAGRHGLVVIEDAAQAHGARHDGLRPGALSHAATFSFYPGKNLGAWGDGGAVYSTDSDLIARIVKLANHGRVDKYVHDLEGRNSRLDGLQAAILGVKLRHMDDWNNRRRAHAARYRARLAGENRIVLPAEDPRGEPVYHLFVVRVADRDAVLKRMAEAGIGCGVHYPVPLHEQPAYAHLGHAPADIPQTSMAAKEILSLPLYPELTETHIDRVADTLLGCLAKEEPPAAAMNGR
jgi:dTDP-4-amino-4,6-dideoxygalactose transaminase